MSASVTAIRRNTEKAEGVRTQWLEVTPQMATHWLEGNTHNRPIRDSVVNRYASDMKAGRWKQTHQGIAFDEENVLIDGQHRLYAIIEAETPVVMQVTRGLPIDSQRVVDDGIRRSIVDIMRVFDDTMSGLTSLHVAIAERMIRGLTNSDDARKRTRQEAGAFLKLHWEAISFTVGLFPIPKRVKGVTNAPVLAALARSFYYEDRSKLTRFAQLLSDGMSSTDNDFTVVKLRNWLMGRAIKSGGGAAQVEMYGKTLRALKAFTNNQKVGRSLVVMAEDPYPLPVRNGGKLRA